MASELMMYRHGKVMLPCDFQGEQILRDLGEGEIVKCKFTRPRNLGHHRKFFALMRVVFDNQTLFPTMEGMIDAFKIAIGHYDKYKIGTHEAIKVRSIDFATLDQTEFEHFYDRMVEFICTKVIPHARSEDLENQVQEILDGRGKPLEEPEHVKALPPPESYER